MKPSVVSKSVFAVVVAGVSVWAFWPEPKDDEGVTAAVNTAIGDPNAKYQLAVAPIPFYMPGTQPQGIGEPLAGFVRVAEAFCKRFPEVQIVYRNVPGQNREWLVTQLSAERAPDIVCVNIEDVWQDVQKGWYLALDPYLNAPNPFIEPGQPGSERWWDVFQYPAITRGKEAPDGKLYGLVLDLVETGIYYNKDKFRELGIELPNNWQEFLHIQQRIKDAGYIPFLSVTGSHTEWGLDLFFDQLYHDILPGIDLIRSGEREKYLQGYLDSDEIAFLYTKGFFTRKDPRWREIFVLMKQWRQYWNRDLGDLTMDRIGSFYKQRGLMMWDGSWSTYKFAHDPQMSFHWGITYLPKMTKATTPYADDTEMCVVGGAGPPISITNSAWRDTHDPATSERLKRVIAFLQFLCVPEQANRIINEAPMFVPNIKGVKPDPTMAPFVKLLERRYTTTKWTATFDLQFNDVLERQFDMFLNNGFDAENPEANLDDFLAWMEGAFDMATHRLRRRTHVDWAALEQRWEALAPVRARMKGLPDGVR